MAHTQAARREAARKGWETRRKNHPGLSPEAAAANKARREKARTEARKAAGLCVRCGQPAVPGLVQCEDHRRKYNRLQKRSPYRSTPAYFIRTYGVTAKDAQRHTETWTCDSCGTDLVNSPTVRPDRKCLDHDHEAPENTPRRYRGTTCHACNVAEGVLKTSERALALAQYLARHGAN